MENKTILKGILLTTTANTSWDSDILYFVRTNSGKTDGYLRLNGKKYGTAEDVKTLLGELPNGYATWRAFVDAVSGQTSAISQDIETLSGLTSANTQNIETLSGLTSANTQNIETLSGLTSAHTQNIEALSAQTSANTEDIEALQEELEALNRDTIAEVGYDAEEDKVYLIDNSGNTTTGAVLGLASKIEALSGLTSANTENIETLSGLTSANTQNITTLSGLTSANTESITTLNADSATTGSVDQKIATAIAGLDGETANTKPAQNAFVEDVTETDGVITVTYGTLPTESDVTATGDTLVSATATGHSVTVGATEALTSAVTNANTAVQSVNTKTGTAITINSSEIDIASDIVVSGVTAQTTSDSIQDALVDLYTKVGEGDNDLAALSAATSGIAVDVETLNGDSATTGSVDQKIATAISDVDGDIEALSAQTTANTENITALSAQTTANTEDIATLKANSATTGSVDQKIATAIAGLDGTTTNTKGANSYVADVTETDGIVTVTYADLPTESDVTATGDTLISATATGHSVTVGATEALTSAVTNANSAVQSVNGESGTAVTIDATEIELGQAVTSGATTILPATSSITESFGDVYEKIDAVSHAAAITSTGNSIDVVSGATGNNIEVNLETGTAQTVEAGHLEIAQNASGELYGVLYYGGDDME